MVWVYAPQKDLVLDEEGYSFMSTEWSTTVKPTILTEWVALPPREAYQVMEQIMPLTKDSRPDENVKKQLVHKDGQLPHLERTNHRTPYTFKYPYINMPALRRESTYKGLEFPIAAPAGLSKSDRYMQKLSYTLAREQGEALGPCSGQSSALR